MVLLMAKQEAGSRYRWPKTLKWRVGNNFRKPRDLTKKRHSDSLFVVNDDDDVVRTGA
jgi:hypothetical protein